MNHQSPGRYRTSVATRVALVVGSALATAASPTIGGTIAPNAPLDDRCWALSFEDEFDTLDLRDEGVSANEGTRDFPGIEIGPEGRWRTRYIWGRDTIINREMQFYVDPLEHDVSPFLVEDGTLVIRAVPTPRELDGRVAGQPFVSGVLTTERSFAQQYGRFEAVAQVPDGQGLWSALWLLPSFDTWPEGVAVLPEIDIMEHLGHEPRTLHTTLHTNQSGALTSHGKDSDAGVDLADDFHLYSVVWTPETVSWYLDREPLFSYPTPADFTRPVHFLMNLAVGGGWPGPPNDDTPFPADYRIDVVRAWKDAGTCD